MTVHQVEVRLRERSYAIHIEPGCLARAGEELGEVLGDGAVLVLSDETVAGLHGESCLAALRAGGRRVTLATMPAGEEHKHQDTVCRFWQACADAGLDRAGTVIALGGGVVGDVAGFVAATWMRGVRLVQIPTTLLAMVDSSIGGKTGFNIPAGKNLVGAFQQPRAVLIDPTVLATMPEREYAGGLAEVAKHGVIRDADFFAWQERHHVRLVAREAEAVAEAVAWNCRIKAWHVEADELEHGVRAHLNYGHTFAHALESRTGYTRYLHGEAVAIGMQMAGRLGEDLGVLEDGELRRRQAALLQAYGLPTRHATVDREAETTALCDLCRLDKKARAGRLRFVVPVRLGVARVVEDPPRQRIAAAFASGIEVSAASVVG